jgi:hypothetical protein
MLPRGAAGDALGVDVDPAGWIVTGASPSSTTPSWSCVLCTETVAGCSLGRRGFPPKPSPHGRKTMAAKNQTSAKAPRRRPRCCVMGARQRRRRPPPAAPCRRPPRSARGIDSPRRGGLVLLRRAAVELRDDWHSTAGGDSPSLVMARGAAEPGPPRVDPTLFHRACRAWSRLAQPATPHKWPSRIGPHSTAVVPGLRRATGNYLLEDFEDFPWLLLRWESLTVRVVAAASSPMRPVIALRPPTLLTWKVPGLTSRTEVLRVDFMASSPGSWPTVARARHRLPEDRPVSSPAIPGALTTRQPLRARFPARPQDLCCPASQGWLS